VTLTRRGDGVVGVIVLAALVIVLTVCYTVGQDNKRVRLQEDDPGWNCHTMGNKVCGP
jgi:hypothetical protein